MKRFPKGKRASIWEFIEVGCDPGLQAGVRTFASRWQGLRTRYKIRKMLTDLIWPPWTNYLESLPEPLRRLRTLFKPERIEDPGGIEDLGRTIITSVPLARTICQLERIEQPKSFEPTIGTLRSILEWCNSAEKLKTSAPSERLRAIRGAESGTCSLTDTTTGKMCEEMTEYIAYLRGADVGIGLEKDSLILRLDETRCLLHTDRTGNPAKAASLAETIKQLGNSKAADNDRGPGQGLCRMCGRQTERDAVYDLRHSYVGIATTATSRLSDRFCAEHISTGGRYHAALLELERYDDTRARLQKQGFHSAELKNLHSNPAVNWFENHLVEQLQIFSNQDNDPRKRAAEEAVWAISELIPEIHAVFNLEIEISLKLLANRLLAQSDLFTADDEPPFIWAILGQLYTSARPAFNRIAVLMLYSLGLEQKRIANLLGLRTRVIATYIRQIAPSIVLNSVEVNLGMAADYIVRRAQITERQMEIIHWKWQNESQSAIAKRLNISRQAVSQNLRKVPNNLRFDKPLMQVAAWFDPFAQ